MQGVNNFEKMNEKRLDSNVLTKYNKVITESRRIRSTEIHARTKCTNTLIKFYLVMDF